jgi:tetratricopeptide (TPR) repeat protein
VRATSQLRKLATMPRADKFCLCLSIFFVLCFIGCERLLPSRYSQLVQDADSKAANGDFQRAINLYEAALDDSPRCAEVHYKLALLYDDKLNDPVSALHHFRRYLALSPNGSHANDAKNSIQRDELAALTSLSGDSVVTRAEAARLRNENLTLYRQLDARTGTSQSALGKPQTREAAPTKAGASKSGPRTYVVREGDTLASISRKFYKSSRRWHQILEANKGSIHNPKKLTVGQTLIIP